MDIKNLKPNLNSGFHQGYYIPTNPNKYAGDPSKIIFRSSWEKKFMAMCDLSENVLRWASEPVSVKYMSPLDKKWHTYYIDFYVKLQTDGMIKEYLVELKPKSQTEVKPLTEKQLLKMTPAKRKGYEESLRTIIKNKAKWSAAARYAEILGYEFVCWTEEQLFKS